jgi:hypothetical protein
MLAFAVQFIVILRFAIFRHTRIAAVQTKADSKAVSAQVVMMSLMRYPIIFFSSHFCMSSH